MTTHSDQQCPVAISWSPWPDPSPAGGLGRPYLITSADIQRVHASPPPSDLPVVWRSAEAACFELPLPTGQAGDQPSQELFLTLYASDGREHHQRVIHSGGLKRPDLLFQPQDEDEEAEASAPRASDADLAALNSEALISQHVESINELLFPQRSSTSRPERVQGRTLVTWPQFDEAFWGRDDRDGPMRLIVRIAIECGSVLEDVCHRPRKALRRERIRERLDRVQQMDDTCIRWFVRQPGRTILEKAGPRQRVMSVVRTETADTPENRVARDFLERCLTECRRYLRENATLGNALRVRIIRQFRSRLRWWLRHSDIRLVSLPVGISRPNYVLQFDDRYRRLWYWYERLRRQQTYEDDLWRWQHRTWSEHVSLALLHAVSALQEKGIGYRAMMYLRLDQRCGCFVDESSSASVWVVKSDGPMLVECITRSQFPGACATYPELGSIIDLGPDFLAIVRAPFARGGATRTLALWSALQYPGTEAPVAVEQWLTALASRARTSISWDAVTPVLAVPSASLSSTNPARLAGNVCGIYGVRWTLPLPLHRHLPWLAIQVRDWACEGVL